MAERRAHPSGRPVVRRTVKSLSRPRIPPDGPLTPRLQSQELTPAVGFLADFLPDSTVDDDEDE